jgi:LacI family transcriptional regulator
LKTNNKNEKVRAQDIAKILKVSASTVSRALNDHPRISKETRERVKQVAARLGYFTGMPELMNPEKAEAVVVLVPSIDSQLYREVVSGVTDSLRENNFQTFILDTQGEDDNIHSFFQTYKKYGISGIIHLVCKRSIPDDFYSVPVKDTLPVVTIFEPDTDTGFSSVLPDMFQGTHKIVNYLKSLKLNKIALILEDEDKPEDSLIISAFEAAFDMSGTDKMALSVLYNKKGAGIVTEQLWNMKEQPQVIIAKGTPAAMEVMRISANLGLKIPDDLLLIAIDTDTQIAGSKNNLSLLKIPAYQMGYEAGKMLVYQIDNPDAERKTEVKPVNFILKGSAIRMP